MTSFIKIDTSIQEILKIDESSDLIGQEQFWAKFSEISRTKVFPGMQFSQNVRGPLVLSFYTISTP